MNSSSQSSLPLSGEDDDMFAGLPALDHFEIKRMELSTQLVALMTHCKETRSSLAETLNWKKSRVTHVFSGRGNPTIRTIFDITTALGHDFDVVFRRTDEHRAAQPWERAPMHQISTASRLSNYTILVQTADQVANDLLRGNAKPIYLTLDQTGLNQSAPSIEATKALEDQMTFVLPDDVTTSSIDRFDFVES